MFDYKWPMAPALALLLCVCTKSLVGADELQGLKHSAEVLRTFYKAQGYVFVCGNRPLLKSKYYVMEIYEVAKSKKSFDWSALQDWKVKNLKAAETRKLSFGHGGGFIDIESFPKLQSGAFDWKSFKKSFPMSHGIFRLTSLGASPKCHLVYAETSFANGAEGEGTLFQIQTKDGKIQKHLTVAHIQGRGSVSPSE